MSERIYSSAELNAKYEEERLQAIRDMACGAYGQTANERCIRPKGHLGCHVISIGMGRYREQDQVEEGE